MLWDEACRKTDALEMATEGITEPNLMFLDGACNAVRCSCCREGCAHTGISLNYSFCLLHTFCLDFLSLISQTSRTDCDMLGDAVLFLVALWGKYALLFCRDY